MADSEKTSKNSACNKWAYKNFLGFTSGGLQALSGKCFVFPGDMLRTSGGRDHFRERGLPKILSSGRPLNVGSVNSKFNIFSSFSFSKHHQRSVNSVSRNYRIHSRHPLVPDQPLGFFIDRINKPKFTVYPEPVNQYDFDLSNLRQFSLIIGNEGKTPILELKASAITRGPSDPRFYSEKTKLFREALFGEQKLNVLSHNWPSIAFFPYHNFIGDVHPDTPRQKEIDLFPKHQFSLYLLTAGIDRKTKHIALQTGDNEELTLGKDAVFEYFLET